MKKREWTKKEKLLVALTVTVVALFLGLVRGARYPALVTWNVTEYPTDYDEAGDYRETTRCWGVPVIYWTCKTTVSDAESQAG